MTADDAPNQRAATAIALNCRLFITSSDPEPSSEPLVRLGLLVSTMNYPDRNSITTLADFKLPPAANAAVTLLWYQGPDSIAHGFFDSDNQKGTSGAAVIRPWIFAPERLR